MDFVELQFGVLGLIQLALVLAGAFAFIDALTRPAAAFTATDKQTKAAWLWITGLGLVCLLVFNPLGFLPIIATVAVCVYLVDVRPAVSSIRRRRP